MGYVFDSEDARRYNEWFESEPGRSASLVQKSLLSRLWSPPSAQRVLEVGCGTGVFLEWFAQQGHQVTGIDPSRFMLEIARQRLPNRIELDRGHAEHLPYEDNAFDTVAMITALEFVDDPLQALQEAFRVARRYVVLGTLNKYSLVSWQRRVEQLWKPSIYRHARFFSVLELRGLVEKVAAGPVPLKWRTCLSLPLSTLRFVRYLEHSRFFHWHPFGHFIAMNVDVCYPMQTVSDPLFCEIRGIGQARLHGSCLRFPRDKMRQNGSMQSRIFVIGSGHDNREMEASSYPR